MSEKYTPEIKSFFFNCGGYFEGYNEMHIETKDDKVVLSIIPSISSEKNGVISKELSSTEWSSFSKEIMTKYNIGDWDYKYERYISDGEQWEIVIEL